MNTATANTPAAKKRTRGKRLEYVKFSSEVATEFCERIITRPIHQVCNEEGMPCREAVYQWLRKDESFREMYIQANMIRAHARKESVDELVEQIRDATISPQAGKVILDALRWQSLVENPRTYGTKITQEVTGKDGEKLMPEMSDEQIKARMRDIINQFPEFKN